MHAIVVTVLASSCDVDVDDDSENKNAVTDFTSELFVTKSSFFFPNRAPSQRWRPSPQQH